jgi:hypothetical protein
MTTPQELIAEALADTEILGEEIGFLPAGATVWLAFNALVDRDPTELLNGDVTGLEGRMEVYIPRSTLAAVAQGKDRVRFPWRGALTEFVIDRLVSEDEGVWHLEVVA